MEERSLNPIFEEPDESKHGDGDDDPSFSDDDSIELPGKSTATAETTKMTFPSSSFGNLITRHTSVSPLEKPPAAEPIGDSHNVSKFPVPRQMLRALSSSEDENETASDSDSFHPPFQPENRHLANLEIAVNKPPADLADVGLILNDESRNSSPTTFVRRDSRKLVLPDSPVLLRDPVEREFENRTLQLELDETRAEISRLVEAVHAKDLNLIAAHDKIRQLSESSTPNKRTQQRLEASLANVMELETRNIDLQTRVAGLTDERDSIKRTLQQISDMFRIHEIPADGQEIGYFLMARMGTLLDAEKQLAVLKSTKALEYANTETFRHQVENAEKALALQNDEKKQIKLASAIETEKLKKEISELKAVLEKANREAKDQEDLGHALAVEARALSEELRQTQSILERKDEEIAWLHNGTSAQSEPKLARQVDLPDIERFVDQATYALLETEKNQLKVEVLELQNRLWQANENKKVGDTILDGRPDIVFNRNVSAKNRESVRRELAVLNSALTQVITASNNAINHLKSENLALIGRLNELEKRENRYRQELSERRRELVSATAAVAAARVVPVIPQRVDSIPNSPMVDWSATTLSTLMKQLIHLAGTVSSDRKDDSQSLPPQESQVALLTSSFRQLESQLYNFRSYVESKFDITLGVREELLRQQLSTVNVKASSVDSDLLTKYQEDNSTLRKMLSDREQDVRHWSSICAVYENGLQNRQQEAPLVFQEVLPGLYNMESVSVLPGVETEFLDENKVERPLSAGKDLRVSSIAVETVNKIPDTEPPRHQVTSSGNVAAKKKPFTAVSNSSSVIHSEMDLFSPLPSPDPTKKANLKMGDPMDGPDVFTEIPQHRSFKISYSTSTQTFNDSGKKTASTQIFTNNIQSEPVDHVFRVRDLRGLDIPGLKLELPVVDYDEIRQRSRNQLAQLENLCNRIDQSNEHHATYLPNEVDDFDTLTCSTDFLDDQKSAL